MIDGVRRPDLVRGLVEGTLQSTRCSCCGYEAEFSSELLIWRSGAFPQLVYIPSRAGMASLEAAGQEAEQLCESLRERTEHNPALAGHLEVCLATPSALAEVLTRDVMADVDAHQRGTLDADTSESYRRVLVNISRARAAADDARKQARAEAAEGSPEWVAATRALALALLERRSGDQESNLEKAIALHRDLLRFRDRESTPREWADIQTNLGIAYRRRLGGTHADNLELALYSYRQAMEVLQADRDRLALANLECSMSATFLQRVYGDKTANYDEALALARRSAPTVDAKGTAIAAGVAWLTLGNALLKGTGSKSELDEAEQCFRKSIDRYRTAGQPLKAGMVALSLAAAIDRRDASQRPKAIGVLRAALEELPATLAPVERAKVRHNLGQLLLAEANANPADEAFEEGTGHLRASLETLTPAAHPDDAREVARELGEALAEASEWDGAAEAFGTALQAANRLYRAAILGRAREHELNESGRLHHAAAYARAQAGDLDGAVESLEGGRALWAASALDAAGALSRLAKELTPAERERLEAARRELSRVDSLERNDVFVDSPAAGPGREALTQRALAAAAEVEALGARLGINGGQTNLDGIARQLGTGEGLVYLTTTRWGSLILIVTAERVSPVWCGALKSAELLDALADEKEGSSYLSAVLLDPQELEPRIDAVLEAIGPILLEPLAETLAELELDSVALIPTGALGLIPLHTFAKLDSKPVQAEISYAPSAAVRNAARGRAAAPSRGSGFVSAANPLPNEQPLPFAVAEANSIAEAFGGGRVLSEFDASKQEVLHAIAGAAYVHFGCHGRFELKRPLTSHLELAGGTVLTLHELLDKGGLDGVRLVSAFACNSGIAQFDRAPDEVLGFATAFLRAGAAGAIVTMWSVQDLPAALFSTRLYARILTGETPGRALASARSWLRQATNHELADWLETLPSLRATTSIWCAQVRKQPRSEPFRHPLHWAPYVLVGA
jgi:CHAT domain-containing protein